MVQQSVSNGRKGLAAACVVAAVLQVALASQLSVFGGRINFMLVLVATLSLSADSRLMVYIGFFAGLFYDLTSAVPLGLMSLLLSIAGYVASSALRGVSCGVSMESLRSVAAIALIVNLCYGLTLFFMGSEGNILYALGVHGLASTALDVLAACPFLLFSARSEPSRGFSASSRSMGSLGLRGKGRGTRYKGIR